MAIIFERLAVGSGYELSEGARVCVRRETESMWAYRSSDFANARDVRNLFERSISAHANRIALEHGVSDEMLCTVLSDDIRAVARY